MVKPTIGISIVKGKVYKYIDFSTKSLKEWNIERSLWYPEGIKIGKYYIYETLTPVGLAFWQAAL
jgi:hypothetical protein